jgi:hypothetical protein
MEPVSLAAGMMTSRLGAVQKIAPVRARRSESVGAGKETAAADPRKANRRSNLPDHLGQNLDITV